MPSRPLPPSGPVPADPIPADVRARLKEVQLVSRQAAGTQVTPRDQLGRHAASSRVCRGALQRGVRGAGVAPGCRKVRAARVGVITGGERLHARIHRGGFVEQAGLQGGVAGGRIAIRAVGTGRHRAFGDGQRVMKGMPG